MNTEKKLYQWDTGQKLTGCTGLYVDFPIDNEVYRVETADGMCIIPDELLQTSGSHKVYECMTNNTIRSFAFSVAPRPKPPDYVFTPTERLTFEGLVQKVDDAVADMIRRAESGEFDGHTPVKGTDYFTASEIQQIQNEVSSGAIGEFKNVVDTETDKFNANATEKVNTYNQNDSQKTTSYNANATAKLNAYNTNANNRVAEFDSHTEQIQTDISELKSDLDDIARRIVTVYEKTMSNDNYFFNVVGNTIIADDTTIFKKSYTNTLSDNWLIECNEGDVFYITANGIDGVCPSWACVSEIISTYANVVVKSDPSVPSVNEKVIIPSGVSYLVVNNDNVDNGSVKKVVEEDSIAYKSDIYGLTSSCVANYNTENTQLDIFIPCSAGYALIPLAFRSDLSTGKHYDVLHIENAKIVDNNLNVKYGLTSTGEWECAIKLSGRNDFMGGINHGDEINTSVSWFIDGGFIEDITTISNYKFNELKCVCLSDMYDPSDETTIVAKHGKEYIFTKEGLKLKQTINWLVDATLRESYLCMLPILDYTSSTKTELVTQHGYANDDFKIYDLFNNDSDAIHSWKRGRTEITTFGKEKGLTVTTKQIESKVNSGITHGGYACIYSTMTKLGRVGYNKHYHMIAGLNTDDSVSVGDSWYTDYVYKFDVSK